MLELTKDVDDLKLRVVDEFWSIAMSPSEALVRDFMVEGRSMARFMTGGRFAGFRRLWRVFPSRHPNLTTFRTHLSDANYNLAMTCVKNGV